MPPRFIQGEAWSPLRNQNMSPFQEKTSKSAIRNGELKLHLCPIPFSDKEFLPRTSQSGSSTVATGHWAGFSLRPSGPTRHRKETLFYPLSFRDRGLWLVLTRDRLTGGRAHTFWWKLMYLCDMAAGALYTKKRNSNEAVRAGCGRAVCHLNQTQLISER